MNSRLRVVIADDERPARSFLAALLRSFEDVVIVAEAASGREAVAAIEREHPDLALLDLQMPELDGIGVVRMLKKADMPLVAFVTAYDRPVRAFEVNAVDYLLKPVEKMRLREDQSRAGAGRARRDRRRADRAPGTRSPPIESLGAAAGSERIPIRRRDEIVIVQIAQIASIVAEGELLYLTTTKNERHTMTYRLKDGVAPRSRALRQAGARDARQHRSDREGERDAGRHARGAARQRPEAANQPPAVEGDP